MNTRISKKYLWLLLIGLLPLGLVACSDSDEPVIEEEPIVEDDKSYPYANFFGYNVMNDVYLWKKDISYNLNKWPNYFSESPDSIVKYRMRYKDIYGKDIDKWTMMTDDYTGMTGSTDGVSTGTYGFGIKLYLKEKGSDAVVGFITYTYPGSPAEKAGLKRGDVIMEVDGVEMNQSNYYDALFASSSVKVGVGRFTATGYTKVEKSFSMTAVSMYEDPVVLSKVFDCGGKKVGYLVYTSFTFESSLALVEVCKEFKKEGVTELILDLRYNGGGYVFTEEVLASMLAPEAEVKNKSVFETEIWNDEYMAYYKEKNVDLNTYFRNEFVQKHNGKSYDINTSDANIGINKIYALVTGSSASASEAILVGLMPYLDIEIIGEQTHGKYCSGIMWSGEEWFQDIVDNYKNNKMDFAEKHPQFADWKKYIADWGIYVMINMYADKDGKNPCMPDGLTPGVEAKDLFEESYQLGDEREAMLNVALQMAGKTDLESRVASRSATPLPVGKAIKFQKNPLDGKRIYTGDMIKPRMIDMP